ncbi:MAG: hypothetical protein Ct9H90mP28_1630 [Paracoccaceae bacterium]|nr:MAG: hypothetical protein Ct9H90mP28_1630 [Paracoccaceae bacterium]
MTSSAIKNPKFLSDTKYLYKHHDELPLDSPEALSEFISAIDTDAKQYSQYANLTHLLNALKAINGSMNSDAQDVLDFHAEYYYKVIASLFTETFHDKLLISSEYFLQLHNNAANARKERHIHLNDVQNSATNATENWKEDADQLALLYERLRANRNHEYINLVDDNTTLLRQAQLNHDMLLRRQFINKMLRDILILVCLFIISGFLNHMGYASTTILTINVVLLTLFGLNFLYSIYIRQKRHELNYKRFGKFLYPKIDQDTQLKYAEGVCSDDDSDPNSKKAKCGGFV